MSDNLPALLIRTLVAPVILRIAVALKIAEPLPVLLDAGADTRPCDPEGRSAMVLAVRNGDREAARPPLSHGAEVEWPDEGGLPPIFPAVHRRDRGQMPMLLEAGSNPGAVGVEPLGLARPPCGARRLPGQAARSPNGLVYPAPSTRPSFKAPRQHGPLLGVPLASPGGGGTRDTPSRL